MTHFTPFELCVSALVLVAALIDYRVRRIPNWLTMSGAAAGLILHGLTEGFAGLLTSIEGLSLGFAAYFVLYCLRAMGAGDVKVMAAVGAILGPAHWFSVFIATALAGGVLAVILMTAKGRVSQTLWNTAFIANELIHFRAPHARRSDLDVKDPNALNMPHGIAIAAGTAAYLLLARV